MARAPHLGQTVGWVFLDREPRRDKDIEHLAASPSAYGTLGVDPDAGERGTFYHVESLAPLLPGRGTGPENLLDGIGIHNRLHNVFDGEAISKSFLSGLCGELHTSSDDESLDPDQNIHPLILIQPAHSLRRWDLLADSPEDPFPASG